MKSKVFINLVINYKPIMKSKVKYLLTSLLTINQL